MCLLIKMFNQHQYIKAKRLEQEGYSKEHIEEIMKVDMIAFNKTIERKKQ